MSERSELTDTMNSNLGELMGVILILLALTGIMDILHGTHVSLTTLPEVNLEKALVGK